MSKIKDSNVLITGAARGIGKLMGYECLKKKANSLIIWDINEETMEATAEEFRSQGFTIHTYKVNVADTEMVAATAKQVLADVGSVDILINNAGVIVGKNFVDHTHKDIDFTININVSALMHVTLAFLPAMISNGKGHIVNIASAAGLMANPKMSVYAASKWAVTGWSESLRIELEELKGDLHVTTVNPSYIDTGMFEGVKMSPLLPILKPEKVAREVVRGIRKNEIFIRLPLLVKFLPVARGVLPTRLFDTAVGKWLGVYKSMSEFSGHK